MSDHKERDLSRNQLGIVDTCFEEGQYTSGIAVLEELRSSKYRPSESHIRQLLYIALYPPPSSTGKGKEKDTFEPGTPSKFSSLSRQQKSPLLPDSKASEAAQRLLASFARTNLPASLFRALPVCSIRVAFVSGWSDADDEDSFVAREATCIKQARCCWDILKEGFIRRKVPVFSTPPAKSKRKQRDLFEDEDIITDVQYTKAISIVADHAWPVLEWFINIFEKDEKLTEDSGSSRYSPLLLRQIPPPRSGTGPRWEANAPLDIAFGCLQQTCQRRKHIGIRLIVLLINLASTVYFDMSLFINLVYTHLSSFTPDALSTFFSILPPQAPALTFKVFLCRKLLTDTPKLGLSSTRPKPQARAIRAARRSGADEGTPEVKSDEPGSIAKKNLLPPFSNIFQLISQAVQQTDPSGVYRVKYELLIAYGILQSRAPATEKDVEWVASIRDSTLRVALKSIFASDEHGQVFVDLLNLAVSLW